MHNFIMLLMHFICKALQVSNSPNVCLKLPLLTLHFNIFEQFNARHLQLTSTDQFFLIFGDISLK